MNVRFANLGLRAIAISVVALTLAGCRPSADSVAAQAAQAQQLLDAGQVREASAVISAAVAKRDDVPAALLVQGRVAMAMNNRAVAFRAYSSALALEASNEEALNGVAQLGLGLGYLREAEDAADKLLVLQPEQVGALTTKTLIAIVRNDLDKAAELADRVLKRQPGDIGGIVLKSRVQALQGDRAGALATLQSAGASAAAAPIYVMALAELQRANGDAAGLQQQLERLKTLAPDELGYRLDLVDLLYRTGAVDRARAETAALVAKPVTDPTTIENMVRLWQANDPTAPTPAMVDEMAQSASLEARLRFARYLIATGRAPLAVTLLKSVATGWSSDVEGMYALARAATGHTDAAQAAAERVLAKDPSNGGALLTRIRQALAERRFRDAVTDAQRVAAEYPEWDEGYIALADAYAGVRNAVGVRRAFEQGLKARPQSLPLTSAYVARLFALGDGQRANEVARRFALDSPALPAGWKLYVATCARAGDDDCGDASAGLAAARTRYGLDPVPGTPPPIAAVGRLT